MDIKTAPLKNTSAPAQIADSTTRIPAKTTDEGKSFVDEMASVPNMEVNKLEHETKPNNSEKDFEFVATTNDFTSAVINEKLNKNNSEILHQHAQKELVDEIVLMNKQEVQTEKKADNISVKEKDTKKDNELLDLKVAENDVSSTKENIILDKITNLNNKNEEIDKNLNIIEETDINSKLNDSVLNIADKNSKDTVQFVTNETKYPATEKDIKSENKETSSLTKISEKNSKKQDLEQIANDKKVVQTEEDLTVKNQEKPEILTDKIKPDIMDIPDKISVNPKKAVETKLNNMPEKNINKKPTEPINNVKNVDNDKNITNKDIEIAAIADKPVKTEEMKVIMFEPISSPIAELDKTLNTSRTSDIVKFLDANLSSEKTSKTNKTSSASQSAQKSSEKAIKMTESDAKFFNNLIETNQQVIEGTKTADTSANIKELEESQSVQVSKTLLNALKESQENNKSFRVDFDKDLSVILKVNKDGKISAEFLPGDKAVEQYLKANLPLLQQQFKDEGLEYENLSYRQHKKDDEDKQKQNNKDNKKENGYE